MHTALVIRTVCGFATVFRMGDEPKHSRSTRRFDSEQLAKLTRHAGGDTEAERDRGEGPVAAGSQPDGAPATSRTSTVHDPMTMALLAEVARTSRTVEIEPSKIEEASSIAEAAAAAAAAAAAEPVAHPRIKRR